MTNVGTELANNKSMTKLESLKDVKSKKKTKKEVSHV